MVLMTFLEEGIVCVVSRSSAYMLAPRLHQHRNVVRIRYLINEYPHEDFHSKIGRRNRNIQLRVGSNNLI